MEPTISTRPDGPGVRLVDRAEGVREDLATPGPVEPTPCSTDAFYFPVDVAAAVETPKLRVPYVVDVYVRDGEGDLVAETCNEGSVSVPPGTYNVDVSVSGLKLYLAVESSVWAGNVDDRTELRFDGPTRVELGVRSYHDSPAGTITVTDDPMDLMAGLSLFGSALKTTSVERSFPNLRGHPPLLERGDAFDAPADLERPDVDVRIEVPPEHGSIFPVASLAYYLAAEVVPRGEPRLVAGGESHPIDGREHLGESAGWLLKRLFLLDCVVRTVGYFDVELAERRQVESLLGRELDCQRLYDLPLAERVNRYLDVPAAVVEEVLPRWRLTADVAPDPANVPALSFFADKLAFVRRPRHRGSASPPPQPDCIDDFVRGPDRGVRPDGGAAVQRRGAEGGLDVVWPAQTDSYEHAWLADGVPLGGNKLRLESLTRRLGRPTEASPEVSVTVVVNDPAMESESSVEEIYRNRDHTDVEVTIARDTSRARLEGLLAEPADFVHYVGHIDERGMQCSDGHLDARRVEAVNAAAFLLNGCRSFEQGQALVDAGAGGGIVTLDAVHDSVATAAGYDVALLLNGGHSLANAARILKENKSTGFRYAIVGDGMAQLLNPTHGTPKVVTVESTGKSWAIRTYPYPSNSKGIGRIYTPYISTNTTHFLNMTLMRPITVSTDELIEYLNLGVFPVRFDRELHWSPDLSDELVEERQ